MKLGLEGKVVLVTGGGMGVGRAISRILAHEGAKVVVNDIVKDRAKAVAGEIESDGGMAMAYVADIIDLDAVNSMVAAIEQKLGPVDILVNNAGVVPERRTGEIGLPRFSEMAPKYWRKIVDLNFYGVMNCVSATVGGMTKRKSGKIISIVSDAGRIGEPRMAVYSGAKAAIIGFSKALAKELGKDGINVNMVSLSAVAHELPIAGFQRPDATVENDEMLRKVLRNYPIGEGLKRLTSPQDAADAVAFLVSDRAAYITGQCLAVNGGFTMV